MGGESNLLGQKVGRASAANLLARRGGGVRMRLWTRIAAAASTLVALLLAGGAPWKA
jgi:hypothetical protein